MKTISKFNQKVITPVKLVRSICFVLVTLSVLAMVSEAANFSGEWSLNNEKSSFGNTEFRNAANKLKIKQDAASIVVERSGTRRNGEAYTYAETITLDGKECENIVNQGRKRKSIATWSTDGKNLTIDSKSSFERDGQTVEMKSVEVFTLTTDKVITVDVTSSSPQRGEVKNKLVYEKN